MQQECDFPNENKGKGALKKTLFNIIQIPDPRKSATLLGICKSDAKGSRIQAGGSSKIIQEYNHPRALFLPMSTVFFSGLLS